MRIIAMMADGFEEAEAVNVIDIVRRAGYEIDLVSISNKKEVKSARNITVFADKLLRECDPDSYDAVFLPGGAGVEKLKNNDKVIEIVKAYDKEKKIIIAICAAPLVLEKAGIINGKKVTSYPSVKDELSNVIYLTDKVVIDGNIITSRGFGTSIDLGLKIVEIVSGKSLSDKLRETIVY